MRYFIVHLHRLLDPDTDRRAKTLTAADRRTMSWVKRIVGSRSFQKTAGVVAAEYLRLVWKTSRFVIEPEDIYERVARDAPVILAMWHGQHFLVPFIRRAQDRAKVLISRHRDGEINAIAAERLGVGADSRVWAPRPAASSTKAA